MCQNKSVQSVKYSLSEMELTKTPSDRIVSLMRNHQTDAIMKQIPQLMVPNFDLAFLCSF